jgi:hypothetical protein
MFAESRRLIAEVVANPPPVTPGMGKWFDYCEAVAPEHAALWARLRRLDFHRDLTALTDGWLAPLLAAEPPPDNINGLWFGLHNPVIEGQPTCRLYLGGSTAFAPDSDSNEWVCDLSYRPARRYASSHILTELYRSVEVLTDGNVSNLGEPFLCHGYTALVVSWWCHGPMQSVLLGGSSVRAIVMGHDSGDFYRVAVLRRAAHSQPELFPE